MKTSMTKPPPSRHTPHTYSDFFFDAIQCDHLARYRTVQAKTLGHADLINTSLALFIKDLFAVVHPAHAARLCGAYIRALRSKEDSPFLVSKASKLAWVISTRGREAFGMVGVFVWGMCVVRGGGGDRTPRAACVLPFVFVPGYGVV